MAAQPLVEIPSREAAPVDDGDDALVRRYLAGEAQAFEALYRRHRGPLYRFLLRLKGSAAEAEEVFQEVWLAVIRGADRYRAGGRFAAWLYAVAHRRAIDHGRRLGRRRTAEAAAVEGPALDADAEELMSAAELGRALLRAVETLPLAQREAFLMQAEGDLTLDEIAAATEVPRETVKSRLRYANRRLRAVLEERR